MTRVICSPDPAVAAKAPKGAVPVLLYGIGNSDFGAIGHQVFRRLHTLRGTPSQAAFDFLAIALSVTAADTFVRRDASPDGWTREIHLEVAVADSATWKPALAVLTDALSFLSGDIWTIKLKLGGEKRPRFDSHLHFEDCVSLLSGGMDSTIGAVDMIKRGRKPAFVSFSYPKEGPIQRYVIEKIARTPPPHFWANPDPKYAGQNETSMRTRSVIFLAYGALVASALQSGATKRPVDVVIPENGFIALNAPLTLRRTGSHSTRTAHPHFLSLLQRVFDLTGIDIRIANPYALKTKGEMLQGCSDKALLNKFLYSTVSCGKWKRKTKQCGRCVPCIIRRAAFHRAGITDNTFRGYRFQNLANVLGNIHEHDDLLAMRLAVRKAATTTNLDQWLSMSGPLPVDRDTRDDLIRVFQRGMDEVAAFLAASGCYP